jgi:hypothetical protein
MVATAFFASNFEFWREAGYFDIASTQKPLLHLWSIAVEEQFYVLFPPLLLFIGTRPERKLITVVAVLLLASLVFSIWAVAQAPVAAFYLLPSRMWELMLGALLALVPTPAPGRKIVRESLALAGLALIALAAAFYQPWQPFPGVAALLPCLGAALVIRTGQERTVVRRLLEAKPIVFIGLISYSLYLWHWPVLVFARNAAGHELNRFETWVSIALSFGLAIASWLLIETPFRKGTRIGWRPLFSGAAAAMAAAATCGIAVATAGGMPERWQPEIRKILAEERNHEPRMDICFGLRAADVQSGRMCRFGSMSVKTPSILLWGDSHADAVLPAVQRVAELRGRSGLFAGSESCAPLVGVSRSDATACKPFNDAVLKVALRQNIEEVILDARWTRYADEPYVGGQSAIITSDARGWSADRASTEAVFHRGLERTVRALTNAGKHVVVVAPVPEAATSVPRLMARLRLAGDKREPSRDLRTYMKCQKFVLDAIAKMKRRYGATVIYPHRILCATGNCEFAMNDRPLYRDEHHLSVYGALQLVPLFAQAF